jgi:hypothetical protein
MWMALASWPTRRLAPPSCRAPPGPGPQAPARLIPGQDPNPGSDAVHTLSALQQWFTHVRLPGSRETIRKISFKPTSRRSLRPQSGRCRPGACRTLDRALQGLYPGGTGFRHLRRRIFIAPSEKSQLAVRDRVLAPSQGEQARWRQQALTVALSIRIRKTRSGRAGRSRKALPLWTFMSGFPRRGRGGRGGRVHSVRGGWPS